MLQWGEEVIPKCRLFLLFFFVAGGFSKLDTSTECGEESANFGCYQLPQPLMRSSQPRAWKWADSKWTPTHQRNHKGICLFPWAVPVCSASRLPPGLLQGQPALGNGCWSRGLAAVRALLWRCLSPAWPRLDQQIHRNRLRLSWVCAWQSYLSPSALTYRATQGQPGLVPKELHLSPEELPHVSKICCCLWPRDEDWSEPDSSLMLLANGPCLPATACTLSLRPGGGGRGRELWLQGSGNAKAAEAPQ